MIQDITKLSEVELKALAYDVLAGIQLGQRNLEAINKQLDKLEEINEKKVIEETKGVEPVSDQVEEAKVEEVENKN